MLNAVPVLVVTGDKDRLVDPAFSEEIVGSVRGAELVKIHGAGHVAMLEFPEGGQRRDRQARDVRSG